MGQESLRVTAVETIPLRTPFRDALTERSPLDALADDIVARPIPPDTTWVEIGDAPGLGVALDETKGAEFSVTPA
jgi:L-alanine-DL-glutamate epimerase-like enolase superfamily enzyme